jgi:long-chain acyl-CoA synthetase
MTASRSLVDMLEASVAAHGPRPAFMHKEDGRWLETTYADFGRAAGQLRGGLASLDVGPGDKVGIIANNCVAWALVAHATYARGAVLVPMYESQRPREWAFIARDAGVKVLFAATPDIRARLQEVQAQAPLLRQIALLAGDSEPTVASLRAVGAAQPVPALHPAPDDVACLLYTSGTTGDPKGVMLSHANILSNVDAIQQVNPIGAEHRTLSFLPWAHAFGHTCELHAAIAAGATLAIAESVDKLADNFAEVRPTVLVAVPRVFQRVHAGFEKLVADKPAPVRWLVRRGLAAARRRGAGQRLGAADRALLALADRLVFAKVRARVGGRLQFAVSGAAALAREVAELIDGVGIAVYEGYGLTEASPIVTANVPGNRKLGSVGRPIPGVRVVIDRAVMPAGEDGGDDGEIVVYGPNVMRGYHDRPAENQAIFTADGGLRTGDVGRVDGDGYLYITGRIKEQYKLSNGKYVSPAPLEERLKLSPLIANAMITGDNRAHNVALIVPSADIAGAADARARIRAEIDRLSAEWRGFERVAAFALVAEDFTQANDMLTPSLKLKRRNVVRRYQTEIEALYRDPPASATTTR